MLKADTFIILAVILAAFFYAAHSDAEATAAQQDAEAMTSREWAGQQVCGTHRTAVWEDDKTLTCLRTLEQATHVAGGRQ